MLNIRHRAIGLTSCCIVTGTGRGTQALPRGLYCIYLPREELPPLPVPPDLESLCPIEPLGRLPKLFHYCSLPDYPQDFHMHFGGIIKMRVRRHNIRPYVRAANP